MPSLSGLARAREWWSYKIPPLLAIAYALMLLSGGDAGTAVARLAATLTSIIAVAAYGYVINDCFDIESDRRAGKTNRMAGLAVWQRSGIVATILFVGWAPAAWVGYSTVACILLAMDFLLPTIYSMPPIRLKERGILGVISDASAAHLVPTLFLAAVFLASPDARTSENLLFAAMAAVWYSIVGLRGILNHQILDREADIASGVTTMVTAMDTVHALKWTRTGFYTLEMTAFALLVATLAATGWVIVPVVVLAAVLEVAKRLFGWEETYVVSGGVDRTLRAYLPFANNVFYNLWLPLALCVEVAIRFPVLAWLPVAHVLVFGARLKDEWRDPAALFQHVRRRWRLRRIRRKWGWTVYADDRLIPRFSQGEGNAARIEPASGGDDPWAVRLVGPSFPVARGSPYQLQVRMRSDRPRTVVVGVCGLENPWPELGLTQRISLDTRFETYLFDFRATDSRIQSGIFLLLGESGAAVEVEEARVVCVAAPGPWTLLLEPGVEAYRTATRSAPSLVRIDRLTPSSSDWGVQLLSEAIPGDLDGIVRVSLVIRSDAARGVHFGIASVREPHEVIGRPQRVSLSPEAVEVSGEFPVDRPQAVRVFFWLGGDTSAVEIVSLRTEVVRDGRYWTIDAHKSCEVIRRVPTLPRNSRVDLLAVDGVADHVVVSTLLPPGTGPQQVSVDVRASSNRPAMVGVERRARGKLLPLPASRPTQLLTIESVPLTESWQELLVEFVANRDDEVVLFLWLGEASGSVEIGDVRVGPAPTQIAWTLDSGERSVRRTAPGGSENVVRVVRLGRATGGVPWKMRLVGAATPPSRSAWQLTLRMRGEGDGRVTFGICEAREPWRPLVEMNHATLDQDWQDFVFDAAPSPEAVAPVLWLGEMGSAVEIAHASLRPLGVTQRWHLALRDETLARRTLPHDSGNVARIQFGREGEHEYDVALYSPVGPVEAGSAYRLRLSLEAERPRSLGVVLDEGAPPWRALAGPIHVFVGPTRTEHVWDFVAVATGAASRLALWLARDDAAVEVGSFKLERIEPRDAWSFVLSDGCIASRTLDDETQAQRIEVTCTHGHPWDVQLTPISGVPATLGCRVRFRVRGTPRLRCHFGIRNPADNRTLGAVQTVVTSGQWQSIFAEFPVESPEHSVAPFFWLGEAEGTVELEGVTVHAIDQGFVWRVDGAQACETRLGPLPDCRDGLAIEVDSDEGDLWDVKLSGVGASVRKGRTYRLRCRVRALAKRECMVGVLQAESPWADVGLLRSILLTEDWRTIVLDFIATVDASPAEVVLLLGGKKSRVDLAETDLVEIDADRLMSIIAPTGVVRRLGVDGREDASRFELAATDDPWRVKASCGRTALRSGRAYRLTVEVRADDARKVLVGVAQGHAPWESIGVLESICVDLTWRLWVFEFVADRDESDATAFLCLGGSAIPVEIGVVEVREISRRSIWRLEAPTGAAVCLAPPDEPEAMRVEVRRTADQPWQIRLASASFALSEPSRGRVSARLRADRDRMISICVAQAHPPWKELGLFRRVALTPQWRDWSQEFTATSGDPDARFFLWLGDAEGMVDVADFHWECQTTALAVPIPALRPQQEGGRDEEVDGDSDNVDQTGHEGAGTVSGIHSQPEEKERQL